MILKILELINILFAAMVGGMYWGPWLALTRSLQEFRPSVFLAVVNRLNQNLASLMTVLSPLSLLTAIPVLALSYNSGQMLTFWFTIAGLLFFLLALIVTVAIEVPIVKQIVTWTETTLPSNWKALRDKWGSFHVVRVGAGLAGLISFLIGALF